MTEIVSTQNKAPGFTLIELLVVITIIALLAALLFPSFGGIRERGRQVTCLSNLRQLGMAAFMYEKDYRVLPRSYDYISNCNWRAATIANVTNGTLWPYVMKPELYICPTFRTQCDTPTAVWSYPQNYYVGWPVGKNRAPRASSVREPAHLIIYTEENWWTPVIVRDRFYSCAINDPAWCPDGRDGIGTFHNGAVHAVFLDGHAERITWNDPDTQRVLEYYGMPTWPGQLPQ